MPVNKKFSSVSVSLAVLARVAALGVCLMLSAMVSACGSLRAYEGPRRSADEVAHVAGDMRVRAGAPLSIILRRVDEMDVGLRYNAANLLPGKHHLLIDCTVTETGRTTRHHLDVDLDAGSRYRLVASTRPGNRECDEVALVEK